MEMPMHCQDACNNMLLLLSYYIAAVVESGLTKVEI